VEWFNLNQVYQSALLLQIPINEPTSAQTSPNATLVGLATPNKAPSPLHKRKSPLLKTFWRRPWLAEQHLRQQREKRDGNATA